jgi:hypothetical protein
VARDIDKDFIAGRIKAFVKAERPESQDDLIGGALAKFVRP